MRHPAGLHVRVELQRTTRVTGVRALRCSGLKSRQINQLVGTCWRDEFNFFESEVEVKSASPHGGSADEGDEGDGGAGVCCVPPPGQTGSE